MRGSGPKRWFGAHPWLASGLVLGALLTSGCRLELVANVRVAEDGSGSVEVVVGLDPDAVDRIGGDLGAVLEADDLTAAGWEVDGPEVEEDGYTRVRIRHSFADAAEAALIFGDITAAHGPFQDFAISRDPAFARTEWSFAGRLDFSGGLEAFGDAGLAAELDGEPLGQSVEELEAQLGEPLSAAIRVRVGVRLPGEVTSNGSPIAGDGAVWEAAFGAKAQDLEATGEEQRTSTLVAAGIGAACGGFLLLYGLFRLIRWVIARRRGPPAARHVVEA